MCELLYGQCCQKIPKNVLQTMKKVYINKLGLFSFMNFYTRETREGGGPCLLLKLRQMGTQRVQMKGVLS